MWEKNIIIVEEEGNVKYLSNTDNNMQTKTKNYKKL